MNWRWEYIMPTSAFAAWRYGGSGTEEECKRQAAEWVVECSRFGRATNVRYVPETTAMFRELEKVIP